MTSATPTRWLWPAAVGALIALQLALVFTHDPWRDEYQALQVALQTPDLPALFAALRYEGHPPLWFLLLRAVGAILPALWVLPVVQAGLAVADTLLIATRAPFPRWLRLAIAISPFLLFEYGVVARGASLGITLTLVAIAARAPWLRWTAVALLPAVEMQFGVISLGLLAIAWRDRWWRWGGFAVWVLVAVAAASSVQPPADLVPAVASHGPMLELARLMMMLAALLVPINTIDGQWAWGGTLPDPWWIGAGPGFLLFAWITLRGRPFAATLFWGFLGATAAMTALLYPLSLRHVVLVALWLILIVWREAAHGVPPGRAFRLWGGILAATGMMTAAIVATRPFDRAGQAAAYIHRHGLGDRTWAAYPDPLGQGVAAITGREMLSLTKGCTQGYIRWDHPVEFTGAAAFQSALRNVVRRHGELWLATDQDIGSVAGLNMRQIAYWPEAYDGTAFRIYRVGMGRTGTPPTPCPPIRRPLHG